MCYSRASRKRTPLEPRKSARLREVSDCRRLKIIVFDKYVAENMTKCPLTRGVHLQEVAVSGGLPVLRS